MVAQHASKTSTWKDLYLSGGAYLGGTAAANKLDDYEEGTFTITNNGDATGVISSQSGTYTKVGNVVHFDCAFTVTTNFTSSSVAGLPFTPSIDSTASSLRPVSVAVNNAQDVAARVANGSTTVTFAETSNGTPHEPDTLLEQPTVFQDRISQPHNPIASVDSGARPTGDNNVTN